MGKSAEYYFGADAHVLEEGKEEDEWEGAILDDSLLAILSCLDSFWRDVCLRLCQFPSLSVNFKFENSYFGEELIAEIHTNESLENLKEEEELQCLKYLDKPFWQHSVVSANARGWDWSGDTDVYVYQVWAKDIKEICMACIIKNSVSGMTFNVSNACHSITGKPWEDFWDESVRGENDLPKTGETGEIARPFSSGNQCCSIVRIASSNTFYVVDYFTS